MKNFMNFNRKKKMNLKKSKLFVQKNYKQDLLILKSLVYINHFIFQNEIVF